MINDDFDVMEFIISGYYRVLQDLIGFGWVSAGCLWFELGSIGLLSGSSRFYWSRSDLSMSIFQCITWLALLSTAPNNGRHYSGEMTCASSYLPIERRLSSLFFLPPLSSPVSSLLPSSSSSSCSSSCRFFLETGSWEPVRQSLRFQSIFFFILVTLDAYTRKNNFRVISILWTIKYQNFHSALIHLYRSH